jgi:hypothetical protein
MKLWKTIAAPEGVAHWSRQRWFHEELWVRENHLEHRVILGRWRRVTRISSGWVYLEQIRPQCYQVRVRGKGGELVLAHEKVLGWEENAVPVAIVALAERIAQKTEWRLDVPSQLRRGAHIRTI